MWSRPTRMPDRYRSAVPRFGLAAWISQMVDAWVTVTSFRTPREPMITPARTSPERLTLPTADCNEVVSSDERPVRWVAATKAAASAAVTPRLASVPSRAVVVRTLKPWATYTTTKMMAADPT